MKVEDSECHYWEGRWPPVRVPDIALALEADGHLVKRTEAEEGAMELLQGLCAVVRQPFREMAAVYCWCCTFPLHGTGSYVITHIGMLACIFVVVRVRSVIFGSSTLSRW